jgi:hypothetical protein
MARFGTANRSVAALWTGSVAALLLSLGPTHASAAPGSGTPQGVSGGFTLARLKYTGGGDWYSDESSLRNLLRALKAQGGIRVGQDKEAVVTATDPELWNYPLVFMTGHGNVKMSDEELRSMRRYLDQGGFLWADDNFGLDKSFRELMRRLYPETPLVELPFSHELFRNPNAFPNGAPKIHEHDGGPARVFAIVKDGRVRVLYTFDCDIGNGIEDEGVHDDPADKRAAAMRFAINVATYAVDN